MGGEEAEERPQAVLDHEGVAQAAAGGGQRHRHAGHPGRVDEIEDVLEQPGIAALVDRRPDDQGIRPLDRLDQLRGRRRQVVAPRRTEARPEIDQVADGEIDSAQAAEFGAERLDQDAGARGPLGTPREGDHAGEGRGLLFELDTHRTPSAAGRPDAGPRKYPARGPDAARATGR